MDDVQQTEHTQGRAIASGAFVAAAGLVAALALVYSNATGVIEVAADAGHQQHAEAALGAVASARNTIGQMLLISGTTDDPALVTDAVAQTTTVVSAMEERVLVVADALVDPTELEKDLAVVLLDTDAVLDAVADGDLEVAWEMATSTSATSFTQLVAGITTYRDDVTIRIAAAAAKSGTTATASRFMAPSSFHRSRSRSSS